MEYIRATVQVDESLYRVYCHHGAEIEIVSLQDFFGEGKEVRIVRVVQVDEFDIDDPLQVIMVDEAGIYAW